MRAPSSPAYRLDPRATLPSAVALLLLVLHGALFWHYLVPEIGVGADDSTYLSLARSVRQLGYRDLYLVGEPPHTFYPPGFPVVLALAGVLFGDRLPVYFGVQVAASVVTLLCTYLAVRDRWSAPLALAALAILAVNPVLLDFGRLLGADMLLCAQVAATLWLLARPERGARVVALAGAIAIAAALTRMAGVALIGAVVLALLHERRPRLAAAVATAALAAVGAWAAWAGSQAAEPLRDTYARDFARGYHLTQSAGPAADVTAAGRSPAEVLAEVGGHVLESVVHYGNSSLPLALGVPLAGGQWVDNVLWGALLLLVGVPGLAALWRRWPVAALFLGCYAVVLVLFPWNLLRLLLPAVAPLVVGGLAGAAAVGERLGAWRDGWRGARRWAPALAAALLLAAGTQATVGLLRAQRTCDPRARREPPGCHAVARAEFFAVAARLGATTPPDAVVMSVFPATTWLLTGRQSLQAHRYAPAILEGDVPAAVRGRPLYLVVSTILERDRLLAARLRPHCDRLQLLRETPEVTLVLRIPDAGARPGADACAALARYVAVAAR